MQEKMFICEGCGNIHDGTYGSGRFCSSFCAHSFTTRAKRGEINKKVSAKMQGRRVGAAYHKTPETIAKWRASRTETLRKKQEEKRKKPDNRPYKTSKGDVLDITYSQLEEYRTKVVVCEICGNKETYISANKKQRTPNKLCADHNHANGKFRGLLCNHCNSRLGWYENNREAIMNYLKRGK